MYRLRRRKPSFDMFMVNKCNTCGGPERQKLQTVFGPRAVGWASLLQMIVNPFVNLRMSWQCDFLRFHYEYVMNYSLKVKG